MGEAEAAVGSEEDDAAVSAEAVVEVGDGFAGGDFRGGAGGDAVGGVADAAGSLVEGATGGGSGGEIAVAVEGDGADGVVAGRARIELLVH